MFTDAAMQLLAGRGALRPLSEACAAFDLERRLSSMHPDHHPPAPEDMVWVVEGDLRLAGNLRLDWDHWPALGLVVTGDLHVDGAIVNADMDGGPFLLVAGRTQARALVGGGAALVFEGDAVVDDLVLGHYNHGALVFRGALDAPAVVTLDHRIDVHGALRGRRFDVFFGTDAWPDVLALPDAELALLDENFWRALEQVLLPQLLAGSPVVRAELRAAADERPAAGGVQAQ